MSHIADFSLQADETPCTILYTIGDQKVDAGKATIMKPKEPLFHSRPIPPNVSTRKTAIDEMDTNGAPRVWCAIRI